MTIRLRFNLRYVGSVSELAHGLPFKPSKDKTVSRLLLLLSPHSRLHEIENVSLDREGSVCLYNFLDTLSSMPIKPNTCIDAHVTTVLRCCRFFHLRHHHREISYNDLKQTHSKRCLRPTAVESASTLGRASSSSWLALMAAPCRDAVHRTLRCSPRTSCRSRRREASPAIERRTLGIGRRLVWAAAGACTRPERRRRRHPSHI